MKKYLKVLLIAIIFIAFIRVALLVNVVASVVIAGILTRKVFS